MQTRLPEALLATDHGRRAEEILRSCVHCGFCNATCPTYQVAGDELDGPRGRIYLIKGLLEGETQDPRVNQHLDRCLTCRACETTCPSGVAYGELLEIARHESRNDRAWWRRLLVTGLKQIVPRRALFRSMLTLGHWSKPLLPAALRSKLPPLGRPQRVRVDVRQRKVILLQGCVQSVTTPEVVENLSALLDRHGIEPVLLAEEGCCGALPLHLGDDRAASRAARSNVEAVAPHLMNIEAVISSASGCGVTVKDYGRLLPEDAEAQRVAAKCMDAAEYLSQLDLPLEPTLAARRIAWSPPCTLQHGQQSRGHVEALLTRAGYELVPVRDSHLCCGSAGTYSLLQPEMADTLRERKLEALMETAPDVIATANVGCHTHLAQGAEIPVKHWLELVR